MKREPPQLSARRYLDRLSARGEFLFSSIDAQNAMGVSPDATKVALHRLSKQGALASPARGFYLIVPPEYRTIGCLPASHFVPDLMERLQLRYYAGLLSAAQYHGAAHQRPQVFQVLLERNRVPLECGSVRVEFIARKRLGEVPTDRIDTPYGSLVVSSPEATAIDLAGYPSRAAGLGNVATVLSELGEKLNGEKLAKAASTAPVAWAQRLGYLLDYLGFSEITEPLREHVRVHAKHWVLLSPRTPMERIQRSKAWRLRANATVELDL